MGYEFVVNQDIQIGLGATLSRINGGVMQGFIFCLCACIG